jgi:hypothetical protein
MAWRTVLTLVAACVPSLVAVAVTGLVRPGTTAMRISRPRQTAVLDVLERRLVWCEVRMFPHCLACKPAGVDRGCWADWSGPEFAGARRGEPAPSIRLQL